MKHRVLEGTDLKVSGICLGGGSYGDKLGRDEVFRQLDEFADAGGNFIDTANVYCRWATGDNSSERLIGEWMNSRKRKNDMIIATKGAHYDMAHPGVSRVREDAIRKDLEESLTTLGTDCIELYWLHRDDEALPAGEIVEWCEKLVKEGKIRYYGFSNWKRNRAEAAISYAKKEGFKGPCAVSNRYSLAYIRPEAATGDPTLVMTDTAYLRWHEETGFPLIPYTSAAGGYYEKLDRGLPVSSVYQNRVNEARFQYLKELRSETGRTMTELSISYLTGLDFPVIPVVSATKPEQLKELISAADFTLPKQAVRRLRDLEDMKL